MLSLLLAQAGQTLPSIQAGSARYVVSPAVHLAAQGAMPAWSQNSGHLVFVSVDEGRSLADQRTATAGASQPQRQAVVRWNAATGAREAMMIAIAPMTIRAAAALNSGAAVFATQGPPGVDVFAAKAGAKPARLFNSLAQSVNLLPDKAGDRALAVATEGKTLKMWVCTDSAAIPVKGLETWQKGAIGGFTATGKAVLGVSRDNPNGSSDASVLQVDLATGQAAPLTDGFNEDQTWTSPFFIVQTTKVGWPLMPGHINTGSMWTLELIEKSQNPQRIFLARGMSGPAAEAPDGLKFAYQTAEGFFFRELVARR